MEASNRANETGSVQRDTAPLNDFRAQYVTRVLSHFDKDIEKAASALGLSAQDVKFLAGLYAR